MEHKNELAKEKKSGFEPILEPGEDWRETLHEFFPDKKLDENLLWLLGPIMLTTASLEDVVVAKKSQKQVAKFTEAADAFFAAYKALEPPLRIGESMEVARLVQRLEYLLFGKDPLLGFYQEDHPRPWPPNQGELGQLIWKAKYLPSVSNKADMYDAREKIQLVEVGRRFWHMLRADGNYYDPEDRIQAPRSVGEHQPFYGFLKVLIRWAGKEWSVERTMKAWLKVHPK